MVRFLYIVNKTFLPLVPFFGSQSSCSLLRGYQSMLLPEFPDGVQSKLHISQQIPGSTFTLRNAGVVIF
jgi:hypothetical protein